jgi:hypothetical protein
MSKSKTAISNSYLCDHTLSPEGYMQWHFWAEEMSKTHQQIQCPSCGLWAIWIKKKKKKT